MQSNSFPPFIIKRKLGKFAENNDTTKSTMDEILKYFPNLSSEQILQFSELYDLYSEWNSKINVISRKDIDNLYIHHVLHSLSIAKFIHPVNDTKILDLGTGGGFPGIPLAIMWPQCSLHLIDRIGKKITVARSVAQTIGLNNVSFQHGDIAECKEKFDFCVSRAVMELPLLVKAVSKNISKECRNAVANGLICLKGGDLNMETKPFLRQLIEIDISDYFHDSYFETKKLIYVNLL